MASAGFPHMGKIKNRLSPAQLTHSSAKNLNLDKNLSNFLGLWQGRDVTDKKK
jgi:hypothetical protein